MDVAFSQYRKLQVINSYFNHAHKNFVYSMTLSMFFVTIVCTLFCSIRFKEIAFVEYMFFPVACLFLFLVFTALLYGSAVVYESSQKLLDSIKEASAIQMKGMDGNKNGKQKKMIRKQCASLKPFGVRIGTLEFISKASVLVIYERLINYSASALIAFPHEYFASKESL